MKLQFWKKDPLNDLKMPDDIGQQAQAFNGPTNPSGQPDELGLATPGMPAEQALQQPQFESFAGGQERVVPNRHPYAQPQQAASTNRDLELVIAKMDALKATLDAMNQRLANLERAAYGDDERRRGW